MKIYTYAMAFLVMLLFAGCKNKVSDYNTTESSEKPNILWLVVEDMSPFLKSYGNEFTTTPTIDSLAREGVVFTNAFSNGAQCSPARSTLISGIYAPFLATDWHRQKRAVPQELYFSKILKDAGYYTTNNHKEDYNANNVPDGIWDDSSKGASYLNRKDKDQPFFSIYNYYGTHTNRIATRIVNGRKKRTIALDSVVLPPYLPDNTLIRDDLAWYYDAVNIMDGWIKERLDELRKSGELENTIIFFYSDHGGCLPRGKAYVYDTGTRVPLIVNAPKKYRDLLGIKTPSRDDKLVGFVDFAPTVLNLAGIEKPNFMMGQAFLGHDMPAPKKEVFLYRANQGNTYIPSRAMTDGRYKLIWNFNSAYPNGSRQDYQWQMPSYQGWELEYRNGNTNETQSKFWELASPLQFFDTQKDPYEVHNLIDDPTYTDRIEDMKKTLLSFMKDNKDLGLYPYTMRRREENQPFHDYVRETNQPVEAVVDAAAFASTAKAQDVEQLKKMLSNDEPAIRYWSTIGILQLLERGEIQEIPSAIHKNFKDPNENIEVRLLSAETLVKGEDDKEALQFILDKVKSNEFIAYAVLQSLGEKAKPIERDLVQLLDKEKTNQFFIRGALINTGYLPYEELWK
ncbi:MAG: hypothetical protein CL868_14250 [Cytophagaceae bacterium]|nr:hypothetical protein [Cytophagaceae bacterium]|tara:strand:- start:5496 stop:7367 length:1872 start_codon:yes stop_codon:yes gene_type:complete